MRAALPIGKRYILKDASKVDNQNLWVSASTDVLPGWGSRHILNDCDCLSPESKLYEPAIITDSNSSANVAAFIQEVSNSQL